MNPIKDTFITIFVLFIFIVGCTAQNSKEFISSADQRIVHEGRIVFNKDGSGEFAYSAVSFEIVTNSIKVFGVFEDLSGPSYNNYFNVEVDGVRKKVLKVQDKRTSYLLADSLDGLTEHTIRITKRTEAFVGSSRFHGFEVIKGSKVSKGIEKVRKILLIGDSFSCGYGNEVEIAAPPEGNPNVGFNPINEDAEKTWSAYGAKILNAQYNCIAYSGRGMYRNNTGTKQNTIPLIYDRIFPDDPASKLWKHEEYNPDVILIKLGTNDFYQESVSSKLKVDSVQFVDTYIAFVKRLHSLHPEAKIVCVIGGMMSDYWPEGMFALTRIKQFVTVVVVEMNSTDNEEFATILEFPTHTPPYGEDWHPSAVSQKKFSLLLVEKLQSFMNWK